MADYISANKFDALLGESSEALAKEALQCMHVQLNLFMRTVGVLEGWSLRTTAVWIDECASGGYPAPASYE